MLFTLYSCICLVGCVTPKALEYAERTGEKETHHWNIKAIKFAAIRDNRFVRLCLELSSPTDATTTELQIDLQQVTEQLNAQDDVVGALKDGVNTESSLCSLELEADEKPLAASVIHSDAADMAQALQGLEHWSMDGPVVSLLNYQSESYLVIGAPEGMYEGLEQHALGSYTEIETHYNSSIFILLPLAIAVDAAIISVMIVMVVVCAIPFLLPLCLPFAMVVGVIEEADHQSYDDWPASDEEEDLFE